MDCQKIRKMYEENINSLIVKYKGQGVPENVLSSILIENTNFVMLSMLQECLSLSRGAQST